MAACRFGSKAELVLYAEEPNADSSRPCASFHELTPQPLRAAPPHRGRRLRGIDIGWEALKGEAWEPTQDAEGYKQALDPSGHSSHYSSLPSTSLSMPSKSSDTTESKGKRANRRPQSRRAQVSSFASSSATTSAANQGGSTQEDLDWDAILAKGLGEPKRQGAVSQQLTGAESIGSAQTSKRGGGSGPSGASGGGSSSKTTDGKFSIPDNGGKPTTTTNSSVKG